MRGLEHASQIRAVTLGRSHFGSSFGSNLLSQWGLAGTSLNRTSSTSADPNLTMEVESSPSPGGGGGKQKKNSPAKKDDSPKKPRHETEEDKHKEIVNLLMQQIEISKKTEERLEETLKVQAVQTQKLDHLTMQLDHTKSQVENMNKDISENKDKVDMLEAKLLSVSDEITNIKRQRAASPSTRGVPSTPTRDNMRDNMREQGTTPPRASTPVRASTGQANTRTPSFNPPFNPYQPPSPFQSAAQQSPAPSVSGGSTYAVNTVAVVRCFAEDTRKGEILEFLRSFVGEVSPDLKPEELYTPFKRCAFGCVKFASAADMWKFIQQVNAAKKTNGSVEIRAKPRQSQEERQRDLNMNRFLRTLYRSSNPPPKDEVDADYRLGKVWVGRFLVAENLKQGQTPSIHEQELKLAMPNMDVSVFQVDLKKIMEGSE